MAIPPPNRPPPKPRAVEAVARILVPKLIVTAQGDWLVDPSHGRQLAAAAAPPVDHVHLDLPGSLHADALVTYNVSDFAVAAERFGVSVLRPIDVLKRMKP